MPPYREPLPDRRVSRRFTFEHDSGTITVGYARFADGRLAEVFIDAGKPGTDINVIGRDAAVILSLALQFGAPVHQLRDALTRLPNGEPAGPVGIMLKMIEQDIQMITCEGTQPKPGAVE